ncbi:hypothetical protein C0J52_02681 [Blattella germanica]|nr:hypothetical protein C0J52_02681 [Blattella germanica]
MKLFPEILFLFLCFKTKGLLCSDNAPSPTGAANLNSTHLFSLTAEQNNNAENSTQQYEGESFPVTFREFVLMGDMKDLVRLKRTPHHKKKHGGGGGSGGVCNTCQYVPQPPPPAPPSYCYTCGQPVYQPPPRPVPPPQPPSTPYCYTCGQPAYHPPPQPPPQPPPRPYCSTCGQPVYQPPPQQPCSTCGRSNGGSYSYSSSSRTAYSYS